MSIYSPSPVRPASKIADIPGDGYHLLCAAILERAVWDALGRGDIRGTGQPARIQQEAQRWLTDRQGAEALLELAGFDPAPFIRQVRRVLDG